MTHKILQDCINYFNAQGIQQIDIGIILGSGFGAIAELINAEKKIPFTEIPHFGHAGAPSHKGEFIFGTLNQKRVGIFSGRLHYYEGHPLWKVGLPIRILNGLKAEYAIITAAAGGLNPDFTAGDIVLIRDHINLMPDNPLRGPHDPAIGDRFPDMLEVYDRKLRQRVLDISSGLEKQVRIHEGVYAGLSGPSLETPAEYQYLHRIGADLVGMSVVAEAITAVQCRLPVLGLSVVSNVCYPLSRLTKTTVEEVIVTVNQRIPVIVNILNRLLPGSRQENSGNR